MGPPKKEFISGMKGFEPVAHRGASAEHPGNTLEAFQRACEIIPGCMLESDVRGTADREIIVFHDQELHMTTDGKGPVREMCLRDIQKLDAGYNITPDGGGSFPFRGKGYRIATLDEFLESFAENRISIDIKDNDNSFAMDVLHRIRGMRAENRVIIGSFHNPVLRFIRKGFPGIATSFGKTETIKFLIHHKLGMAGYFKVRDDALLIPEFTLSAHSEDQGDGGCGGIRVITPGFIADAHDLGVPVYAWTINRSENMKRLLDWGIDGIITDYPDRLRDVMTERGLLVY